MSSEIAINIENVSKHYLIFDKPEDRLKQMIFPRLQSMLRLKKSQFYIDFSAVENVSFKVDRGQTVGIIGRNGSGKSTLLQMVCGTLTPTTGNISVHGRVAALLELGAGFNPEFTGRENVFLNASILGLSNNEIVERFESIERFADIGVFIDQPVKSYSSGMFVRLAFAVATSVDPDILIIDEALSVGDEAFQRKCFTRIEEIKDKGCTILFVSHGAQTIVQLCDRAVLLDKGELLLDGPPKFVVGQYQRLVNARGEKAAKIREDIIHLKNKNLPSLEQLNEETAPPISPTTQDKIQSVEDVDIDDPDNPCDFLDPNLVSQSRIDLDQQGALITGMQIKTLQGKPVNVLKYGRRYVYEYNVKFNNDAHDVSYGMLIKSVSGLALAGAANENRRETFVKALSEVKVQFEFTCYMTSGTYFTNAGVMSTISDDRCYLHRILDGLQFRVINEYTSLDNGLFSLGTSLTTSLISS